MRRYHSTNLCVLVPLVPLEVGLGGEGPAALTADEVLDLEVNTPAVPLQVSRRGEGGPAVFTRLQRDHISTGGHFILCLDNILDG